MFPHKIICLTEESVETLYLLGKEDLIAGVSVYAKRPVSAQKLQKVTAFTHANINKILGCDPDLVIGFSDIQKDIARDLIGAGVNVWISNQRSLAEIFDYVLMLARIVGEEKKGQELVRKWKDKIEVIKFHAQKRKVKPRLYFEEWDEPRITAIGWVSELMEICGGENIFKQKSQASLAKERIVTDVEVVRSNPQMILGCWCGKDVDLTAFEKRSGYENVSAIKDRQVFELPPEIFLQPGPALFEDGLDYLTKLFDCYNSSFF